jgi:hypothetical protein
MEATRPSQGAQLAGIGGLALIVVMLLFAWYGLTAGGTDIGFDAFDAFRDWMNFILLFAAFCGMALALVGSRPTGLPVSLSALTAGLGGISVILIIIYLISPPGVPFAGGGVEVDLDRKIGVWFGLIAAAVLTLGGWQAMQSEGTSFGAEADRVQRRAAEREERPWAPPPPAPPPSEPREPRG